MANFNSYVPKLKALEGYGKYTNNPVDKGGATMSGITLRTFRQFYGQNQTVDNLKAMTEAQWREIIKRGYWDIVKADYIEDQAVAEIIVDWAVNSGPAIVKKVQVIIGVTADGIVGACTIGTINRANARWLFEEIKKARIEFFKRIAAADPSQRAFLKGWINRINSFNYFCYE